MPILIAVFVLAAVAVLCAVLLTVSSVFFGVKEDERIGELRECLPGANCGACGFSGCDGYAKALAEGVTNDTSRCTPGGNGVANRLSAIMGVEAKDVIEQVAYVACGGDCSPETRKFNYKGPATCKAANTLFSGDRVCNYACLGYGDCINVCPRNAISINERGTADIDPKKCIGCGLCVKTCPNGIIHLIKDTETIVVRCSNRDKGVAVRKACLVGCISCGKCEKTCPNDAIHVMENLATIDYDKCTACGACVEVCPVKCIHTDNFICGSHFE